MKKQHLLLSAVLISSFFKIGCATYSPPAPRAATYHRPASVYAYPRPVGMYHQVEAGQTLWALSRNYGVSVGSLMDYNYIGSARALHKGSRIFIPARGSTLPVEPLYVPRAIKWQYIIIHHSATDVGSARSFDRGHRRRGWRGLGYHFVIDNGTQGTSDGDIEVGRRWFYQMSGAHCNSKGMNRKAIGICLVGNFGKERVSKKQLDSLVSLVDDLMHLYNIPIHNVRGHRSIPGEATSCPGTNFPWARLTEELSYRRYAN